MIRQPVRDIHAKRVGRAIAVSVLAVTGAACGSGHSTAPLSHRTTQRIDRIAFRIARSNGDPQPTSIAITQSRDGGRIHVTLHGRFACHTCGASPKGAARITKITLVLDPQTLHVASSTFGGTGLGHGSVQNG
jgi:hypothetical protein